MIEQALFWIFAVCTVLGALGVVVGKNPIASAMSLVATFFFLAGLYVLLWAHTIAVFQVLVYAGAIMVLFLFVIMLLSLSDADLQPGKATISRVLGGLAAAALFVLLGIAIAKTPLMQANFDAGSMQRFGTLKTIGEQLYTVWLLPFEAVSLLLLASIVGAVVVAKSRI
jgi:NADH-quinone oxidoreductase subunit J